MNTIQVKRLIVALIAALSLSAVSKVAANDALIAEIERHAVAQDVELGVAAIRLSTGETISVNGDKSYPMASTYKVPMAAFAFHLVEEGELGLEQMIPMKSHERMKWSPVNDTFSYPGVSLSLLNWIEPMLIHSDNTATDVVLNNIGGGERVTRWMKDSGIDGIRVDRTTADLIRDFYNMPRPADPNESFAEQFDSKFADQPDPTLEQETEYYADLNRDPRDQSTPMAMATLLQKIWTTDLINAEHRVLIRDIMARCETGRDRLSGKLPAHALPVAHKTGTISGTLNDVGVITLPDGKGEVAIVVFTRGKVMQTEADWARAARAIAEVSRSVYDYFVLQ